MLVKVQPSGKDWKSLQIQKKGFVLLLFCVYVKKIVLKLK